MTSPTIPAVPKQPHLAGLDGLRAIAVVAVIVYHLTPGALPGGYIGVDVFFVISGFLITGMLLRERESSGRIRLSSFWARRARRLLPALVVLLLVCCTAAWVIGGDVLVHLGRQVLGAATFSSNWLSIAFGSSYFDQTSPELFRNLWSLAVEEQFYLAWPFAVLVLAVVRPRWLRPGIVAVLAVASALAMAALYLPPADATRVYYGTDTHSFGLALGALLALVLDRRSLDSRWAGRLLPPLGLVGVAGVIAAAVFLPIDSPLVYRGGLAVVALLTAVAILGSVTRLSLLGRVLDVRPLRWVGVRSYGLYLWHWPVFVLVVAALPGWDRSGSLGWALGGIALVITIVAAALSYRFIEQPIRRDGFRATVAGWVKPLRRGLPRLAGPVAGFLVLVVALVGTVFAVASDPGQTSAEALIASGARALKNASPAPTVTPTPTPLASGLPQVPPPASVGSTISAIGDSVMLAAAPELQTAFPGIDIDAVVSRQASAAPAILQQMVSAGTLRQTVLIGLGTNGPIDPSVLTRLRSIVGPKRQIIVVNIQAPRGWVDGDNDELSSFAAHYRNVELADWRDAIAGQLDLLARDQIHPGPRGGAVYVTAVEQALQTLDDRSPLVPHQVGQALAG